MAGCNASIDLFWVVSYAKNYYLYPVEAMPFLLLFSVDSRLHTLFARCWTISAWIVHVDYPRPLCRLPAAITRILRGRYADYLRRSTRLSAAVRAEQPRNSAEKLRFPCHIPYALSLYTQIAYVPLCLEFQAKIAHKEYTRNDKAIDGERGQRLN